MTQRQSPPRPKVIRLLAAVVLFAGAALILSPGSAQAAPYWQPYTKTSTWHCTQVFQSPPLVTESCVVINGIYTQAVAIVTNDTGSLHTIAAPHLVLSVSGQFAYDRSCLPSNLNTGFSRACFGPTLHLSCTQWVQATAHLTVDGVTEVIHSPAGFMC